MTVTEAINYIHSNTWKGLRPGLARTQQLLGALGDPQKAVRCIHVAGTNGKGSVCAMLYSILRAAGYRVGMFTSPYIRNFRENRAIPLRVKIVSVSLVWLTIGYCIFAVVEEWWWAQLLMALLAIAISWHILSFKTLKK